MVSVKDLRFAYSKKNIFTGLSLQLEGGYIYGLLGKNGSGKSTLLRALYGLLFPNSGSVSVFGQIPQKRLPSFLQKVFMVPEEFYLPDIHIDELTKYQGAFYPAFNLPQFKTYLKEFEVPYEQSLQQMSYGQKKKVLISLGLATNTRLLLMDEPTNGLDIISKSQFRKIMAGAFCADKCIVISTHQLRDLENLVNRVLIIDAGQMLFDQGINEIGQQLSFSLSAEDSIPGALYSEQTINGTACVTLNTTGEETRVDLELLYKTVMTSTKQIKEIFN